jgi:hypothetical protein
MRAKIATFALILGLGGLGGYAMSSNGTATQPSAQSAEPATKVIRRTVHKKPPRRKRNAARSQPVSQSLSSQPVSTGSSGGSSGYSPVSSGSSGSGGGGESEGYEHEGGEGGGEGGDD